MLDFRESCFFPSALCSRRRRLFLCACLGFAASSSVGCVPLLDVSARFVLATRWRFYLRSPRRRPLIGAQKAARPSAVGALALSFYAPLLGNFAVYHNIKYLSRVKCTQGALDRYFILWCGVITGSEPRCVRLRTAKKFSSKA